MWCWVGCCQWVNPTPHALYSTATHSHTHGFVRTKLLTLRDTRRGQIGGRRRKAIGESENTWQSGTMSRGLEGLARVLGMFDSSKAFWHYNSNACVLYTCTISRCAKHEPQQHFEVQSGCGCNLVGVDFQNSTNSVNWRGSSLEEKKNRLRCPQLFGPVPYAKRYKNK